MGQTRDVDIYKITIADTIEDRLLEIQDQKFEIAKQALSRDGAAGAAKSNKLSMKDVRARTALAPRSRTRSCTSFPVKRTSSLCRHTRARARLRLGRSADRPVRNL